MKGFFEGCSSRRCDSVNAQVARSYDRIAHKKGKPPPQYKGGIKMSLVEAPSIRIPGELGRYTPTEHGMGIDIRRCKEFNYVDKNTHKHTSQTCTEQRIFSIPRDIIRCYEHVSSLLSESAKGKMGRKVGTRHRILALVACSGSHPYQLRKGELYQAMSPAIISAVTGDKHNAVRRSVELLVKDKKLVTAGKLDVLAEQQVHLPPKYQQVFDDFIKGETEERIRLGGRRLYERDFIPAEPAPSEPTPEHFTTTIREGWRMPAGYKMSKKARKQAQQEAEEWKTRTGITQPALTKQRRKRSPVKARKAPKRRDRYDLEQALGVPM